MVGWKGPKIIIMSVSKIHTDHEVSTHIYMWMQLQYEGEECGCLPT